MQMHSLWNSTPAVLRKCRSCNKIRSVSDLFQAVAVPDELVSFATVTLKRLLHGVHRVQVVRP